MGINDLGIYNMRMAAGLEEKLYFLEQLSTEVEYVLDFGCGDGVLLEHVAAAGYKIIGIDNNSEMRKLARDRLGDGFSVFSYLQEYYRYFSRQTISKTAIILSSVVHELFSYRDEYHASGTIDEIFKMGFKQICIRDMAMLGKSKFTSVKSLYGVDKHKHYSKYVWWLRHSINSEYDLYHFLLKYRYDENWQRELEENYLPHSIEEILELYDNCAESHYSRSYFEHKVLPYTRKQVSKDFSGLEMNSPVNYKVIYERR